ncbi:hypothetical protein N7536_009721 [Penicillium majusculum]|uniref:Uncharacterized protein n=1 Tax=Penicillium solitum TaxID=60172 RepID=A0A1V6R5C8_9EURO|nr:uncharacterized protein PENSOL_c015G01482 [Penicillium solitum]KAJ5687102.1 hypothetical protein N7536_009721 [Penicillium majusculum]OQD96603.1 hypothetical protein PENSOL_c015G01482 [Penicillium solitum]
MASTVPVARAVTGDSVEITTMPTTTLAMSSIFTAPASCSSSWTYEPQGANDVPNGLLMQNAATKDNADPACFPSGYSQYGRIRPTIAYSPGYCPGGYTSADLVIHSPATTAMCCPSHFSYYEELRDSSTTFGGCISEFPSSSSTIVTVRQVSQESTQVNGPVTMWAQPIQIELQASDKSLFVSATTTSDTTLTTATTSSTQRGPASPNPATPTSPNPADPGTGTETSGLSTGARIGVGVGVGAAGLIIIAALAFWLFRRRQNKGNKTLPDTPSSLGGSHPEASELGGSTQFGASPSYQRPGHGTPSELGGSSQTGTSSVAANTRTTGPSELDAANPGPKFVHELGA